MSKDNNAKTIQKVSSSILRREGITFTTVVNPVVNGVSDPAALGIYTYLVGKPDDWVIHRSQLQTHFNLGARKLRKHMDYLRANGLIREEWEKQKGKFSKLITILIVPLAFKEKYTRDQLSQWQKDSNALSEELETVLTNQQTSASAHDICAVSENIPNKNSLEINERTPECCFAHAENAHTQNAHLQMKDLNTNEKEKQIKYSCATEEVDAIKLFYILYALYPRQRDGSRALKVFLKMTSKLNDEQILKLFNEIESDIKFRKLNDSMWADTRFVPYFATYLNGKRWKDELELRREAKKEVKKTGRDAIKEVMAEEFRRLHPVKVISSDVMEG